MSELESVYAKSLDCVHCGLCLSSCPTYLATGRETSSPRGRVYLMRAAAEGRAPLSGLLVEEAGLCLGCRACETACPSGVRYGTMLEETRAALVREGLRNRAGQRLERFLLRAIVPHRARLRAIVNLLGLAQVLRLDRLALAFAPPGLRASAELMPRIPPRAERAPLPARVPAEGERRGAVALFTGCVMSELFAGVHTASAHVLAKNGYDVVVPRAQRCCGALQAHAGDAATARELADANARVFDDLEVDALVVDSAGCGAAMRDAGHWLGDERGARYAGLVRDVCEFLDAVGLRQPAGRVEARVCYDDPCHLIHGQGVADAPRRLLGAIDGLELVAHRGASHCCGAAGTYNLMQPEMSAAVLADKLDALADADPDVIATGNPGCLMQLRAGALERGLRARVVHPVELLDAAYA